MEQQGERRRRRRKEVLALSEQLRTVIQLVKKMIDELEHISYELKKMKHNENFNIFQNIGLY